MPFLQMIGGYAPRIAWWMPNGKTIEAAGLRSLPGLYVAEIQRGDQVVGVVALEDDPVAPPEAPSAQAREDT